MMTQNRRIALNFVASYGRSLFSLVCGLFTGRWILAALGQVDYGLWGVVGGLTSFIVFFNGLMAGAVSRFYAVSVGKTKADYELGIKECRAWFSVAVCIHTILPTVLIIIGYPIGIWAVEEFLTIPAERIPACVWVWRSVCVSCYISMINVPFRAMYAARQEIAELTVYSVFQTLVNVCTAYYMVTHPGDWLSQYAWILCLSSVLPQGCICVRAMVAFQECRFTLRIPAFRRRLKELGGYVLYRFWGVGASMLQNRGVSILVNKYIGPVGNATMTVGNTVSFHTVTLSDALCTAMGPALFNAYGEGAADRVKNLALQTSKIGTVLYLFVVVPAAVEVGYILKLWLVNPPDFAAELCLFVMGAYLTERMTGGQVNVIYATGKIRGFQILLCLSCLLGFALAWVFLALGWGIVGVGFSIIIFKMIIMAARCFFARRLYSVPIRPWLSHLLVPTVVILLGAAIISGFLKSMMSEGLLRLMVSCMLVEMFFVLCACGLILDSSDRKFIREKIINRIRKCK